MHRRTLDMAVSHIYFLLLNLIAILIASGTDVCSCDQCRGHRNRIDRCECCRYYQIGRKRSEVGPASFPVSEQSIKGNVDYQPEQEVFVGRNSHFWYQLEKLRHAFVAPCRRENCLSLWPLLKGGPRTHGPLPGNVILNDKTSASDLCNCQQSSDPEEAISVW